MRISYIALLLAAAGSALGAAIGELKFEQEGAARLAEPELLYNVQQRPGQEYDPARSDADLKRLYETGNFSDVTCETQPRTDGRVDVIYRLKLKPVVRKVTLEGNAKFKLSELEPLVKIQTDRPLSDQAYQESVDALRKFYQDKGYSDATVTPLVESLGPEEMAITFRIDEKLRLKINRVRFEGNALYSQWTLRHAIANRHSYLSWLLDTGLLNRNELELDRARLRDLYWDRGYLDFKIDEVQLTPDPDDPEYVDLTFKLQEGKPYTVSEVTISGNRVVATDELLALIRLRPGEIFNYTRENESRQAIIHCYESLGYANVICRPVRSENFEDHTVKVDFAITEGEKYTVRDVIISGNTETKDKVIRRELAVQPFDPVDQTRIDASVSRLMGMGYFSKVKATTVNADAIGEKDVHFVVEEKPDRFGLKLGAGFSDVNSVVGMVELTCNNFDLFNPGNWFYGGGQRLRAQGLFGIDTMGFNVDFTEPWLFDIPLRLDLSGYGNQVYYEEWNEQRVGARGVLSYRIFDDFTSVSVGYKFEQVNVYDMSRHVSGELWRERGRSYVSQPSIMLERDTRDSLVEPTEGYLINLFAAVSPRILGSSDNFYRLEAKAVFYHSFFDKAIVWMAGAKIGTVAGFSRGESVPLYERYFLGGGDTLRGFPYREVSPTDVFKNNIGGQSMFLFTSEISHPIWNFIRGAAFIDVGNAWHNSFSFSPTMLNVGVGYGLRIKLPVLNAPIKLDLAYPVVNNQDDLSSKLRFHFNMGFTW